MGVITRDSLRSIGSRRFATVPGLEDTGHEFRVRSLSELESSELFQSWQLDADGKPDPAKRPYLRARLLQLCLVGEDNLPIFETGSGFHDPDLDEILGLDSKITQIVGDFLFDHLGMTGNARTDVEELAKN